MRNSNNLFTDDMKSAFTGFKLLSRKGESAFTGFKLLSRKGESTFTVFKLLSRKGESTFKGFKLLSRKGESTFKGFKPVSRKGESTFKGFKLLSRSGESTFTVVKPVSRKGESTFTVFKLLSRKGESIKKRIVLMLLLCIHFSGFAQKLYFPPVNGDEWQTLSPQSLHWNQAQIDSLYNYLEQGNTKAFLLLKDGKIVLEKYFGNHAKDKLWYWASAGKSLTAFLIGIAQQEKHLSITDPTSKYLGEGWTGATPDQESKITVWNQLTMTSGLNDANNYCTVDSCLTYAAEAGTRWAYHNAPYTLLDNVLQKATGSTLTDFVQLKLKDKTGITGAYYPVGYNRIFHSTARIMARYGLLVLNKGNWNGNQILTDTAFFNRMVNTSQPLNKSYGYLWWLNGKSGYMQPSSQKVFEGALIPNAPADVIAALGANGQIIHVAPSRNMVVIRMGDAPGIKENAGASSSLGYKIWEFINRFENKE